VEGIVIKIKRIDGVLTSYTFVKTNNGDYFFHKSDDINVWRELVRQSEKGLKTKVQFTPVDGPKGPRASDVKIISVF